uniref:ER membrane protein complex subunit 6 n=1 Tax=Talaromyces marneffei PM1 TaxID=1077442 RepID=A0A093USZ9_TALMA
MPPTRQELSLLIHPLVPESVQHNRRVLSQLRSLTAFILGISAGILGLQSTAGFAFYFAGTLLVSGLVQFLLLGPSSSSSTGGAGAYYPGASGGEIEGIDDFGKIRLVVVVRGKGNLFRGKQATPNKARGNPPKLSETEVDSIIEWITSSKPLEKPPLSDEHKHASIQESGSPEKQVKS